MSDLPDALDVEPNNQKQQAQMLATPVAVNGRINAPKDLDFFRFKSERDQRLTLGARPPIRLPVGRVADTDGCRRQCPATQ